MSVRDRLRPGGRIGRSEQTSPAKPALMRTLRPDPRAPASPLLLLPAAHTDLRPVVCVATAAVLFAVRPPPLWNGSQLRAPPGRPLLPLRPGTAPVWSDPLR